MSSRITINVGFFFEKQHYAQLQGYIPRNEALNIPELLLQEKERSLNKNIEVKQLKVHVPKSQSKKESQDQISEEDDINVVNDIEAENQIDNDNDNEIENDMENQQENLMDPEQQNEVERALEELEKQNYDSQDESEDQDDIDLSSMSQKGFNNNKTKRQKGQTKDLIQLPDRRPRKDKKFDEATEIIRREQKERKRKQYLKKQVEANEKATLQKILNETGRKLRMREQKQMHDEMQRQHKVFKTLGNVPKIITLINEDGITIMAHNSSVFPQFMTTTRDLKMKQICSNCGSISKYKLKECNKFACSLPCYKLINVQ